MRASGAIVCDGVIDGTSIVSANVFYALQSAANYNNGQTPGDTAFTYDNFPPLNAGYYVWQATKITDSDGKTAITGKMCLGPTTDFLSGTEVYAVSASNSQTPTSWATTYNKEKGKYLWTATRVQYTNGSYGYLNPKCVGYWGEDGTSPYFADIDNEMVSVACDYQGNTTAAFDKTVNVGMWHGSAAQALTALSTTSHTNFTITPSQSGKTVRVQIAKGVQIAQVTDITITIACENSGNKTLHLYVNGVRPGSPGEKAVLYDLIPSASAVKCDKSNTLTPSSLTCDVQRSEGSSVSRATSSHGTLYYRKNGDITSTSDGTALTINTGSVSLASTDTYVTFAFFDTNGTLRDKERVPVTKDGNDGNDAADVQPNILLRTIFDKTIDFVLEAWTRTNSYINIDGATDTIVNGRKSIRLNASSYSSDIDFQQDVYGRIKTSTWYTLSFNYFATQAFYTFLWDGNNSHGIVDTSAGYYLDGVFYNSSLGIDGNHQWPADWTGARHSITFKTKSSFGTTNANVLFRCPAGGQVAICMPKLEEGKAATAYMAHEDDLKGIDGDNAPYDVVTYGRSKSRTSYGSSYLDTSYGTNGWGSTAPSATSTYPYIWERRQSYNKDGELQNTSYVCLTGAAGPSTQGKMGRFLWYAGLLNEVGGTTFSVDDYQAPYVNIGTEDEPRCYAYVGSNGTNLTFPSSASSYTPSNGWEDMTTDFKYLIAKAIFSSYAQLGGFIVNKDYFLSQYGTLIAPGGSEITINASNVKTKYNLPQYILYGNNRDGGRIIRKVSFTVSSTTIIGISAVASSKENYDIGAVGELDSTALQGTSQPDIQNGTNCLTVNGTTMYVSGTQKKGVQVSVSAGTHFFYIVYAKDGSDADGDDKITFAFSGATFTVDDVSVSEDMTSSVITKSVVPYAWFDPSDPVAETAPVTGYKFRPTKCINALTGEEWMAKGKIHVDQNGNVTMHNIMAVDGDFGGIIKASSMYLKCQNIDAGDTIDPANGAAIKIPNSVITSTGVTPIYLPRASQYPFLTLIFYRYFPGNESQTIARICASGDEEIYTYTYMHPENGGVYRSYCKSFYPPSNYVIRLHAIDGHWCLECDEPQLLSDNKIIFYDDSGNKLTK